jgi:dinuclear metal center YbgI/SA1388 family protein
MRLREIIECIENYAPLKLQESYDNSGLIIGEKDRNVKKALLCVDVTEEVIEEANMNDCDLVISHHPLIFGKGVEKIGASTALERIIIMAIKDDIAIYAAHTNLDNSSEGLNRILCDKLGIKNNRIISPKTDMLRKLITFCPLDKAEGVREAIFKAGAGYIGNYDSCSFNIEGNGTFRGNDNANPYVGKKGKLHTEKEVRIETIYPEYLESKILKAMFAAHPYEEVAYDIYPLGNKFNNAGAGLIGELAKETEEKIFLEYIKKITKVPCIRHTKLSGRKLKKIAVCTGSGSFIIRDAISAGADMLVTADMKYHQFFDAEDKIVIADIGHYESEQFVKELLYMILNKKFPNFAFLISETNTNPVYYL